MPNGRRTAQLALFILTSSLTLSPAEPIENEKLSGEIESLGNDIGFPPQLRPFDEVSDILLTPDGTRVVYVADDDYDGVQELFSVPTDGSTAPCKIHDDLAPPACTDADVVSFAITGDGAHVVYLLGVEGLTDGELWIAPTIRTPLSPAPTRLLSTEQFLGTKVAKLLLAPYQDGAPQQLVFNARPAHNQRYRLYSVSLSDGIAGTPVELGKGPVDSSPGAPVGLWQISPNAEWIAYIAPPRDNDGVPRVGVYSAEIGVPDSEIWLNENAPLQGDSSGPTELLVTADSTRVVYLGREFTMGNEEVLSVPIDADNPVVTRISPPSIPFALGTAAAELTSSSSGAQIAYRWEGESLRTARADGTLGHPACNEGGLAASDSFAFVDDSQQLVFTYDGNKTLRVCSTGGSTTVRFTAPFGSTIHSFRVHPNTRHVTLLADLDTPNVMELYTMPIDGDSDPVRIHEPRLDENHDFFIDVEGGIANYQFTNDGSQVVFQGEDTISGAIQLYSAAAIPPPEGGTEILLSAPLTEGYNVSLGKGHTLITPNGLRVVFAADRLIDGVLELYSVPIDGSANAKRLNRGYAPVGGVVRHWSSPHPDSSSESPWIVYLADQDTEGRLDLYALPGDRSAEPVMINDFVSRLSTADVGEEIRFSEDGGKVYFLGHSANSAFHKLFFYEFQSQTRKLVSSDQSEVASNSSVSAFRLHPDQERLVYLADHRVFETQELFITGPELPPVRIGDELPGFADIREDFEMTPDGSALVISGNLITDSQQELFKLDLSSGARTRLSDMPDNSSDVPEGAFEFVDGGQSIVFLAPRSDPNKDELHLVSLTPPETVSKVSGNVGGEVEGDFQVSSGGNRVLFRADAEQPDIMELYSVDLMDAEFTRIKLHENLNSGQNIMENFVLGPRGSNKVAFQKNTGSNPELLLASIDVENSADVVFLQVNHNDHDIGNDFMFCPNGDWLVFRSDARENEVYDLYKVSTEEDAEPILIAEGGSNQEGVISFAISPDGYRVAYRLSHRNDDSSDEWSNKRAVELYSSPLDRSGPTTRLDLNLDLDQGTFTDVSPNLVYLTDNSQLLFTDDREKDDTQELHSVYGRIQVSPLGAQTVAVNESLDPIRVEDFETPPEDIGISVTSTDPALIPPSSLVLGVDGLARTVTLTPAADSIGGPVTITMMITANGEHRTETITFFVGTSEYRLWLEQWVAAEDLDDPQWDFHADGDGDGISNLAEWGKGLNPTVADSGSDFFELRLEGTSLVLRYRRPSTTPLTLQTTFQMTTNLRNGPWNEVSPEDQAIVITDLGDAEIVEVTFPMSNGVVPESVFLRAVYVLD